MQLETGVAYIDRYSFQSKDHLHVTYDLYSDIREYLAEKYYADNLEHSMYFLAVMIQSDSIMQEQIRIHDNVVTPLIMNYISNSDWEWIISKFTTHIENNIKFQENMANYVSVAQKWIDKLGINIAVDNIYEVLKSLNRPEIELTYAAINIALLFIKTLSQHEIVGLDNVIRLKNLSSDKRNINTFLQELDNLYNKLYNKSTWNPISAFLYWTQRVGVYWTKEQLKTIIKNAKRKAGYDRIIQLTKTSEFIRVY
ncbi:hypothetical protein [Mycoplasma phocimorsus]|uniref:hypothetical protein n=1 Tax=Mycoplasma phocimorsus TaxID=3045839 RepID=UPI0024BFED5C|nr:hypothetical protein [Mycoplasma phocimorsus]MDJ1646816.1 hypothetical protein [Mycoplasma phocimorsus]